MAVGRDYTPEKYGSIDLSSWSSMLKIEKKCKTKKIGNMITAARPKNRKCDTWNCSSAMKRHTRKTFEAATKKQKHTLRSWPRSFKLMLQPPPRGCVEFSYPGGLRNTGNGESVGSLSLSLFPSLFFFFFFSLFSFSGAPFCSSNQRSASFPVCKAWRRALV